MANHILQIDSSARIAGSATRSLTAQVVAHLKASTVTTRDLSAEPIPHVTQEWVAANFTPKETRTPEQASQLALSDALIDELQAADTVVIGVPIYNFNVPAAFKAWVDHIARAGVTFQYTDSGPKGLLTGKRAIVVVASGGVKLGSEADIVSPYMTQILGFVGITDVTFISADQMAIDPENGLKAAQAAITDLAA
ncbi:MAG: NAD(P)H-dependent oxidoreductase [Pseudomonadota bacterium]